MDPRWLILAGALIEVVGVLLLASKPQDDSAERPCDGAGL